MKPLTQEDILGFFRLRRSIRAFSDKTVSEDAVRLMISAAGMAPTARNIQPWEFVVVRDKERLKELTRLVSPNGALLGGADAGIVVFCQDTKYYLEDGSAAITQALLAGAALGVGTCWIAGDKKDYAVPVRDFCGAPDTQKLIGVIAVGHPSETPSPKKRAVDEMVHKEIF